MSGATAVVLTPEMKISYAVDVSGVNVADGVNVNELAVVEVISPVMPKPVPDVISTECLIGYDPASVLQLLEVSVIVTEVVPPPDDEYCSPTSDRYKSHCPVAGYSVPTRISVPGTGAPILAVDMYNFLLPTDPELAPSFR
jgi:hypothetical protein